MGDRKQSIYAFNNADSRFLTMSPQIFTTGRQWDQALLSTSYRMTNQMAMFLNQCCQGALPIKAIKDGPKVKYMICDTYGGKPLQEIKKYLNQGYHNQDIFVLTPSVRSERSPVRHLANQLTKAGIAIYVPTTDEEKLDDDVLKGKIVFSTFHQVKGLERPVVMVFSFDHSYYTFYAKDIPSHEYNQIPNTLYVAITRAKEQLILLHDNKHDYLEFLRRSNLSSNYCSVEQSGCFCPKIEKSCGKKKEIPVTELVKYVPVAVIDQCIDCLTVEKVKINTEVECLDIPIKTKQDNLYESVSEITGSAIPSYYEYMISGKMTIYDYLRHNKMAEMKSTITNKKCLLVDSDSDNDSGNEDTQLYRQMTTGTINDDTCQSLLQITTNWVCEKNGYNFKKKQIKQYDWLSSDTLEQAMSCLDAIYPPTSRPHLQFEKYLIVPYDIYKIIGFVDIYDGLTGDLWELKVVKEIDNTHLLQTAIYCWMMNKLNIPVKNISVFNIINHTEYRIHAEMSQLNKIVDILLDHRKLGQIRQSNQEFLEKLRTPK
jgi:hypothetical protein